MQTDPVVITDFFLKHESLPFFVLKRTGVIQCTNRYAERLLGQSLAGLSFRDIVVDARGIFDLARVMEESDQPHLLDLQPAAVDEVLLNSMRVNNLQAHRKGVDLEINRQENIPPIVMDAAKIEQAITNLVSNAIDHSNPDSLVTIDLSCNHAKLFFSVRDKGSGIPAEALELFQAKPEEFDLVITDMTMPEMTGDRLAAALMEIRPDIPIILCTGYSKNISDQSAFDIGIKAFAYKPIVMADLANTVRKVLDEAKGVTGGQV